MLRYWLRYFIKTQYAIFRTMLYKWVIKAPSLQYDIHSFSEHNHVFIVTLDLLQSLTPSKTLYHACDFPNYPIGLHLETLLFKLFFLRSVSPETNKRCCQLESFDVCIWIFQSKGRVNSTVPRYKQNQDHQDFDTTEGHGIESLPCQTFIVMTLI